MKVVNFTIEIPRYKNYTEVDIVGDSHFGNKYHDNALWELYYTGTLGHEGFKTAKNTYVICIGDLMETALKESLGVQDQNEWIEDQYLWTKRQLQPIKDDGRLIALVEGNHEKRASRNWFRTTRMLSKELDVPYTYGILLVNLTLKKGDNTREYKICAHHGYGNARTKGGKMNSIMRMRDIIGDADLYVMGHLHDRMAVTSPIYIHGEWKDRVFGMTGAYMEYGGYAEDKLYTPPARGSLKAKFHFDIDRVSAR